MNLTNRVQLIGNLTSDPTFRVFESGNVMLRFTLCTMDVYKVDDKFIKDTQYHTVVARGKTAEIAAKNLHVNDEIVIDGRLTRRSYTDKNGIQQFISEVVASAIICKNLADSSSGSRGLKRSA